MAKKLRLPTVWRFGLTDQPTSQSIPSADALLKGCTCSTSRRWSSAANGYDLSRVVKRGVHNCRTRWQLAIQVRANLSPGQN